MALQILRNLFIIIRHSSCWLDAFVMNRTELHRCRTDVLFCGEAVILPHYVVYASRIRRGEENGKNESNDLVVITPTTE